jgi:hypothetical protein
MSLDLLKLALSSLENGDELPRECRDWLRDGLAKYYLSEKNLEKILGLKIEVPPGGHYLQPLQLDKRGRRNRLIQELAKALPGANEWQRAELMATLILRYPGRSTSLGDAVERLLDQLMHCDVKLPRSPKQLQRIVAGETVADRQFSGHNFGVCVRDPFSNKLF